MPLSLVPRERHFFTLFREDAANVMEGLKVLNELLNSESGFTEYARRLKDLEHQGDEITHRIIRELNATFITPFDREDIYALASALDDVLDLAEEAADTIVLDAIDRITSEAREMGAILIEIGQELLEAFAHLESRKGMEQFWVRIHDLENQGDKVTRQAIGALFQHYYEDNGAETATAHGLTVQRALANHSGDPVYIIKWKDVYSLLEKTVDRTEDVANILENVTIKNA